VGGDHGDPQQEPRRPPHRSGCIIPLPFVHTSPPSDIVTQAAIFADLTPNPLSIMLEIISLHGHTVLLALWRWLWPLEAQPTQNGRRNDYVTREQLELALEESSKESEFMLNEWYEKFNTLHLRLSKRVKREAQNGPPQLVEDQKQGRPSIAHLRRLGSV